MVLISSTALAQVVPIKIIPQLITIQKQDVDSGKRLQQEGQMRHTKYDDHNGNRNLEIKFSQDLSKFF